MIEYEKTIQYEDVAGMEKMKVVLYHEIFSMKLATFISLFCLVALLVVTLDDFLQYNSVDRLYIIEIIIVIILLSSVGIVSIKHLYGIDINARGMMISKTHLIVPTKWKLFKNPVVKRITISKIKRIELGEISPYAPYAKIYLKNGGIILFDNRYISNIPMFQSHLKGIHITGNMGERRQSGIQQFITQLEKPKKP